MRCYKPINIRVGDRLRENVPCGKCACCLSNKRSEWVSRLKQEWKVSESALFITLTYADQYLPVSDMGYYFEKQEIQKFIKRLRKMENKIGLKYYLVAEYGENGLRPHYHAIIFNLQGSIDEVTLKLLKTWKKGLIHVGACTDRSIQYVAKYVINRVTYPDGFMKPFSLMSKGLGKSYIEKAKSWHTSDISRNYLPVEGGKKVRLPRYYRDKIFSQTQKRLQRESFEKQVYDFDENKLLNEARTANDAYALKEKLIKEKSKSLKI